MKRLTALWPAAGLLDEGGDDVDAITDAEVGEEDARGPRMRWVGASDTCKSAHPLTAPSEMPRTR
jgi:hypothetical protein